MKIKFLICLSIGILMLNFAAYAQTQTQPSLKQKSQVQKYEDAAFHKLSRGATNTVAFWTEIPDEIYNVSKEEGALKAWTFGFVQGLWLAVCRGVTGVAEVLTFPIAPGQKPLLEPEYADGSIDAKIRKYAW